MAQDVVTSSMKATEAAPLRMTFEEFLHWGDEDTFAEWVDGEVILLTTTAEHQIIAKFLVKILEAFIETRDLGLLLFAPFVMKIGPGLPGREPDILFIARENLSRLRDTWLDGPADLAVEIVSPDSRFRDRVEKFREYAEGGVREYWLIDPPRRQAEFFARSAQGVFVPTPIGADGKVRSVVLEGFWLDGNWLWQAPPPTLPQVLEAWAEPATASEPGSAA